MHHLRLPVTGAFPDLPDESPLHTIRHCSRTKTKPLFHIKKNWISRNMTKTRLHTILHWQQFLWIWILFINILYYSKKSTLCSSRDHLLWRMRFTKKFFTKCSVLWQITRYTLFVFHMSFIISSVFVVVCEQCAEGCVIKCTDLLHAPSCFECAIFLYIW